MLWTLIKSIPRLAGHQTRMSLSCGAAIGNPVTKCDLSCEAAARAKPRARLCEPWVATNKHLPSRGAVTETNPYATCSIVAPLRGSNQFQAASSQDSQR